MSKYYIDTTTPEEALTEIVKWLKSQASNHRVKASRAVKVSSRKEETTMGTAYQDAADFLERIEIRKKS